MEFEWDDRKAAYNLQKHGVAFSEASTVFYDPLAITFRGDTIRIISARVLQPKERKLYESRA
jgi:hypothetical protein